MKIGIDMLGLQSPHSRGRGIGRYAASLLASMISRAPDSEFLLYAHQGFPIDGLPEAANVAFRPMPEAVSPEESADRLARTNPDGLEHLLILSPFEVGLDYAPPAKPLNGLAMSAVVYDLLPFLFQERHLTDPPSASKFYRNFERLRRYDHLLAISEATRTDLLRLLGIPGDRVTNIQGASNPEYFSPATGPMTLAEQVSLKTLGIDRPFLFCVASADPRKNLWGLIDAFRLLDESLRRSHQLVVTCFLTAEDANRVRSHAENRGIADSLALTGEVPDETLRLLYRRCEVFAFPSLYEGLGLPLLEAMHCGAPVIAGNNSSQPEFVGEAGILVNAHDAGDIRAKLAEILTKPDVASRLRERSPRQAARFRWEATASRALAAIKNSANAHGSRRRFDRARQSRPRLAFFSPFPPKSSGIADYSARLVRELRHTYVVDLYHDSGYEPNLGHESHDFAMYDHRLFAKNAAIRNYHAVLYQMGNSLYHRFIHEALLRHPGLVTLHDFGLAGFHHGYSHQEGVSEEHFEAELRHSHPERADFVLDNMDSWVWDEGTVQEAFAARDLPMNRRVFERASVILVHSPIIRERASAEFPEHRDKVRVAPMGSSVRVVDRAEKQRIRRRFGLPGDGLIFGSFGILHASKMNNETVEAFAKIAQSFPDASLVFAGADLAEGETKALVEVRTLTGRVRFLGRQEATDFADLIAAIDVGICLRRPPTNGETSAALLDLLRHGIPTIATDTGTFRDYPERVIRLVSWENEGIDGLARAMIDLARDREDMGRAAIEYVEYHHGWNRCARGYINAIESCRLARSPGLRHPLEAAS